MLWAAAPLAAAATAEDTEETGDAEETTVVVWATGELWEGLAVPGAPRRTGSCAADAGRAKITARIKASRKAPARPPQAYRHTRRVQAATFDRPILERMAAFPSTARKPRQLSATPQ